jgi:hypothetical protein
VTTRWHHGNATKDTQATHGWILGNFIEPANDVRSTREIEVKWGIHSAGDKRANWTSGDLRTTLLLLVGGKFRIDLTEGSRALTEPGDYTLWGPGIDHSWEALADSIVITVRWPSAS